MREAFGLTHWYFDYIFPFLKIPLYKKITPTFSGVGVALLPSAVDDQVILCAGVAVVLVQLAPGGSPVSERPLVAFLVVASQVCAGLAVEAGRRCVFVMDLSF